MKVKIPTHCFNDISIFTPGMKLLNTGDWFENILGRVTTIDEEYMHILIDDYVSNDSPEILINKLIVNHDDMIELLRNLNYKSTAELSDIVNKTILSIDGAYEDSEIIIFTCSDNSVYIMIHEQDCCEYVRVVDVCGNVDDLLKHKIYMAEESSNVSDTGNGESSTWTFYKFATLKGHVTIRWLGESNGYYSESVSFLRLI